MVFWLQAAYWTPVKVSEVAEFWTIPILTLTAAYAPIIILLQKALKNSAPLRLKWVNVTWNFSLSLLSGVGAFVMLYDSPHIFRHIYYPMRDFGPGARAVWTIFTLTKALEFGDTFLLCLRKRSFIYLHFFHHLTVALVSWHGALVGTNYSHYPALINMTIHWVMYSYYAFAILIPGNSVLRAVRPFITGTQLVQMFFGMWFTLNVPLRAARGFAVTDGEWCNALVGLGLFACYAYLFAQFFIDQYIPKWNATAALGVAIVYVGGAAGVLHFISHGTPMDFAKAAVISGTTVLLYRHCLKQTKDHWIASRLLQILNPPLGICAASPNNSAVVHLGLVRNNPADPSSKGFVQIYGTLAIFLVASYALAWNLYGVCFYGCARWVLEWNFAEAFSST